MSLITDRYFEFRDTTYKLVFKHGLSAELFNQNTGETLCILTDESITYDPMSISEKIKIMQTARKEQKKPTFLSSIKMKDIDHERQLHILSQIQPYGDVKIEMDWNDVHTTVTEMTLFHST